MQTAQDCRIPSFPFLYMYIVEFSIIRLAPQKTVLYIINIQLGFAKKTLAKYLCSLTSLIIHRQWCKISGRLTESIHITPSKSKKPKKKSEKLVIQLTLCYNLTKIKDFEILQTRSCFLLIYHKVGSKIIFCPQNS